MNKISYKIKVFKAKPKIINRISTLSTSTGSGSNSNAHYYIDEAIKNVKKNEFTKAIDCINNIIDEIEYNSFCNMSSFPNLDSYYKTINMLKDLAVK